MINVRIASIVKNLDSSIDFLQPLYESITNSLQANAKHIEITIYEESSLFINDTPSMIGFKIIDDGDGFTQENIDSFCTLWSDHKAELGCRGSGRFTWLNVFNSINIVSEVKTSHEVVTIPFSMEFDEKSILRITNNNIEKNHTEIEFKYVTEKYYRENSNEKKGIDKRCLADVDSIKVSIIDYLFITFARIKDKGGNFFISLTSSKGKTTITPNDIKEFSKMSFVIEKDFNGNSQSFEVKYAFVSDKKGIRNIALCSNNRSSHLVKPNSVGIKDKLPNLDSLFIYVTSNYFDGIDTDDRRGLDVFASSNKEPDIIYSIAYSEILSNLSAVVKSIIIGHYPELSDINKKIIEEVKMSKPYLNKYINEIDEAVLSKESVESEAIRAFEKEKNDVSKKFVSALKQRDIDPEYFSEMVAKISLVSAVELGAYIDYRSQILKALDKECLKENNEAYLHNIFMPKHTESDDNSDYLSTNMWILDDKFMNYLYAGSDVSINRTNISAFGNFSRIEHDLRRPDMFVVYDRKSGKKNAVMIEYKAPSASLDEKFKALRELPDDIQTFRDSNEEVNMIWAYIITKLDKDFIKSIRAQDTYTEIFTVKDSAPMFYRYNKEIRSHIFICDIESIVEEAKVRNSVFSSIISNDD